MGINIHVLKRRYLKNLTFVNRLKFFILFILVFLFILLLLNLNSDNQEDQELSMDEVKPSHIDKYFQKSQDMYIFNNKLNSYFNINNDASLINWAHAVNNRKKLNEALLSDVLFLEADILFKEEKHNEPIMAHPPQTDSDLTFTEWLRASLPSGKGLKLDFKTPNAVEPCLKILKQHQSQIKSPIILNADIFRGQKATPVLIDPYKFLNQSLDLFPNSALSIGWTTSDSININYTWSDVFHAYNLLKANNLLHGNTEIQFAVRALWSTKSLFRLLWLQTFTKSALTVWSYSTDPLTSLDSLLLFRKYFPDSSVYYDLPSEQYEFFKQHAYDRVHLSNYLEKSNDKLVKFYLKESFSPSIWTSLHGTIYQCDLAALMINNGASFASRREYKAKSGSEIYEVYGKFEVFSVANKKTFNSIIKQQAEPLNNSSDSQQNNNQDDNNLEVNNNLVNENPACVRISIRSSSYVIIYDDLNTNFQNHAPGSINIYIFSSGLVRIFSENKLEQEANLQPSNNFEFFITDVGETNDIHIDINSYDDDMNEYSVQLLVKANYRPEQTFFITQTLLTDNYAVGIDALKVSNEISDPQDRDSVEQNI